MICQPSQKLLVDRRQIINKLLQRLALRRGGPGLRRRSYKSVARLVMYGLAERHVHHQQSSDRVHRSMGLAALDGVDNGL